MRRVFSISPMLPVLLLAAALLPAAPGAVRAAAEQGAAAAAAKKTSAEQGAEQSAAAEPAAAPAAQAAAEKAAERIRKKLEALQPPLAVESVAPSPAPGLYEVRVKGGPILYATADGRFFVLGDLFAVRGAEFANLSEEERNRGRLALLAGVGRGEMIIFPAAGAMRAAVAVFTDVDCIYCQQLHREVPALNRAGVEVRYLAYPRAGIGSASYRKIASAWCAANPRQAITALKNLEAIPDNVCPGNPVAQQLQLGQEAGVRGTPALVLEDGSLVPGYLSAEDLLERLGLN